MIFPRVHTLVMSKINDTDIWHDDEGIWRQIGSQTYGPFATEEEAERFKAFLSDQSGVDNSRGNG